MWRFGVIGLATLALAAACGSDTETGEGSLNGGTGGSSTGGAHVTVEAGAGFPATGGGGATSAAGGAAGTSTDGGGAGASGGASDASAGGTSGPSGNGGNRSGGRDGGSAGGREGGTSGAPATGGSGGASAGGAGGTGGVATQTTKLDLLIVVDNSSSMGDKQEVLKKTIPDLVDRITNPTLGILDLHVGVITSSLGDHGSGTTCAGTGTTLADEEENDHGHLLATRPRAASLNLAAGFASWLSPAPTDTLVSQVQDMVVLAGEVGCGFEATLESAYRFLVDPTPPASIVLSTTGGVTRAVPSGIDSELLTQRSEFLRPDSAIAIIVISDENDCSIKDSGQNYLVARSDIFLPKAATVCDQNPNDACCYSCGVGPPSGCQADPACAGSPSHTAATDEINLRCYAQRRRFGLDFLYPVERYINALSKPTLCITRADLDATLSCPPLGGDAGSSIVRNPLFPLPAGEVLGRDPSMVYFLGIVGVPWQTIRVTKDSAGNPLPADSLVYPTSAGLASVWPTILGNPALSPPVSPTDPLMIESVDPRTGTTPGTGEALAGTSAAYMANSVNGHEQGNLNRDDLQHVCIFPIETPKVCTSTTGGCDCQNPPAGENNPVCQAPTGTYGTTQYFAKAYPGLRHLSVIKGLGERAAVASICVKNLADDTRRDFGYRPAVDALMVELDRSIR